MISDESQRIIDNLRESSERDPGESFMIPQNLKVSNGLKGKSQTLYSKIIAKETMITNNYPYTP